MTIDTVAGEPRKQDRLTAPPPDLLAGASLFLDFDGTLVEIAQRPDAVVVGKRIRGLVEALVDRLEGRVAVVSGRAVATIQDLLAAEGIAISGSHGTELRWADGRVRTPARPAGLERVLAEMRALAERFPGVLVEEKPFGAGLHFREAPDAEHACRTLAERLAGEEGLHLQAGKMLFEVRAGGHDKGSAIRAFMAEPPFAGAPPVFVGDDVTDEDGFRAAAELGGAGVLVGPERPTAATYRLEGVGATLAWLEAFAGQAA